VSSSLASVWRQARGPQRLLYATAVLFAVSALFHTAVYALTGGPWEGAVTWRKPIEFSASFAVATATFAWILGLLPSRQKQDRSFALVYAASSLGEVALIIMQRWRGTASHFNSATPFDTGVFAAMGILIVVISVAVLWLAFRAFGPVASGDRPLAWAIRLGLVFFVAGLGIGYLLLGEGQAQASLGAATSPVTVGPRGALTLPHALALHALQVLLILAWLSGRSKLAMARRLALILVASAGYLGLLVVELSQALAGSAPLELAPLAAIALGVSSLLICGPFAIAVWRPRASALTSS
jgi:hypothetical protein